MRTQRRLLWAAVSACFAACQSEPMYPTPQPGDYCGSVCPCGTILYRLQQGSYSGGASSEPVDTCGTGLTASALSGSYQVTNSLSTGLVAVATPSGLAFRVEGPVICNQGGLSAGPFAEISGPCEYTRTQTAMLRMTADNHIELGFSERRSQYRSVASQTCPQTGECNLQFALTLSKPVQ